MPKRAIIGCYCGSFDPITRGHMDFINRAQHLCNKLVIGVGMNPRKNYLFTLQERLEMLKKIIDETLPGRPVEAYAYNGPTVEFAAAHQAHMIIKGLRGAADYAYEEKMAIINHRLNSDIDTIFLFTDNSLRDVSSSVAKEIAIIGADPAKLDHYLHATVKEAVLKKYADEPRGTDDHELS